MSFKRLILYRAILFLVLLSFSANSAVASDIAWPVNIEKRLVREDTNQGEDMISKWDAATLNKLSSDIVKYSGLESQLYSNLNYVNYFAKLNMGTFENGLLLRKMAINNQIDGAFKSMINDFPLSYPSKFNYVKLGDMPSETYLGSYFDDVIESNIRNAWEASQFEKLTTDIQIINKLKFYKNNGGELMLKPKICANGTCSFSFPDLLIKYNDPILNVSRTIYVDMKYYIGEDIANLANIESKFTSGQRQVFFIDQFTPTQNYALVKSSENMGISNYKDKLIIPQKTLFKVDEIWVITIHPQEFKLIMQKIR